MAAGSLEKPEIPCGLSIVPFPSVCEIPLFEPADYKYGINLIFFMWKRKSEFPGPGKAQVAAARPLVEYQGMKLDYRHPWQNT